MKKLAACLSVIVLLASCSAGSKKVVIISQGTADVNTDDRTIIAKGSGHEEKTVLFYESGSMDLTLSSQAGNTTVTLPEDGVYFLNLKKDTIVGSFVNYTAPKTEGKRISDDELRASIDSLQQIVSGNVSKEKRTFFILPNQAVKITGNENATIITPFHRMTSMEVKEGETPEVYRFYPIAEVRATLEKLKGFTGDEKPVNDPH
jgi:hypothetical protein